MPHLTELFRSAIGLTVWQYVKRRRLMRARQLLESTDADIADVAAQLGYRSVSHFSQSFRAEFGIGPGGYRSAAATVAKKREAGIA
jgi:AraC family transcriptional regulator, arabinose operon regulatory protein